MLNYYVLRKKYEYLEKKKAENSKLLVNYPALSGGVFLPKKDKI